jgi:hypothetical protein
MTKSVAVFPTPENPPDTDNTHIPVRIGRVRAYVKAAHGAPCLNFERTDYGMSSRLAGAWEGDKTGGRRFWAPGGHRVAAERSEGRQRSVPHPGTKTCLAPVFAKITADF